MHHHKGFTLIELLVVIAIIAILSVVVILTLNPAELLRQSRDSNRISDMASMNSVLGIYAAQGGTSFGNSNTVYVSIPDPSATSTAGDQCQGLGLISLPATYSYHCAASSTDRSVNGTGWIPVNLTTLAGGSPIGSLPQDPVNTSSSRLYYTYDTNGTQYEVTSAMESQKYGVGGSNDVISNDGGILASVYEKGSITGLEPLDYGDPTLVGWWPLTEGTGTIAYDYSGNNATGSWTGTQAGTNGYYSTNAKVGPYAGAFDGSDDTINPSFSINALNAGFTVSVWINPNTLPNSTSLFGTGSNNFDIRFDTNTTLDVFVGGNTNGVNRYQTINFAPTLNAWTLLTMTFNGSIMSVYQNGIFISSEALSAPSITGSPASIIIGKTGFESHWFSGSIDDVRFNNRALSPSQIAAVYAGGK